MSSYRYCKDTEAHDEHTWVRFIPMVGSEWHYCLGVTDSAELVAANRVVAECLREVAAAQARALEAAGAAGAVAWRNRSTNELHLEPEEWALVPGEWEPR